DMGAIDLVVQVEAPPSVAAGIQRIGRAGHQLGAASSGILFPKYRADLVACAALTHAMHAGLVESIRYARNPRDVLAGGEKGHARVGELDEEMVFESKPGETFLLGASTWRIEEITHDRVLVSPAPGEPGKMPFWKGDGPGRPLEFGRRIGQMVRELRDQPVPAALTRLITQHDLDPGAA